MEGLSKLLGKRLADHVGIDGAQVASVPVGGPVAGSLGRAVINSTVVPNRAVEAPMSLFHFVLTYVSSLNLFEASLVALGSVFSAVAISRVYRRQMLQRRSRKLRAALIRRV